MNSYKINVALELTFNNGTVEEVKFNNLTVREAQTRASKMANCLYQTLKSIKLFNNREDGKFLNSWLKTENMEWVNKEMIDSEFKELKRKQNFLI